MNEVSFVFWWKLEVVCSGTEIITVLYKRRGTVDVEHGIRFSSLLSTVLTQVCLSEPRHRHPLVV